MGARVDKKDLLERYELDTIWPKKELTRLQQSE